MAGPATLARTRLAILEALAEQPEAPRLADRRSSSIVLIGSDSHETVKLTAAIHFQGKRSPYLSTCPTLDGKGKGFRRPSPAISLLSTYLFPRGGDPHPLSAPPTERLKPKPPLCEFIEVVEEAEDQISRLIIGRSLARRKRTSSRLWSYMPRDAHTHRIAESQELRSGRRDRNPVVPFPLERNTSLQDLHLLTEGEFRANSIDTRMNDPLPAAY
jgi:hypothetical protein